MPDVIHTPHAPAAVGPYSQAIRAGGFVFCSGQIAINPTTQTFEGGSVEGQTRRVLTNLAAVLEAAGTSLGNVVKTTIYLTDMADFAVVNAVYAEYFDGNPPARATITVAALPKNAVVEIEAIATI